MAYFSVIVPCCDVAPFVDRAIESVLSQSFRDIELILSVEESKDETREMCLAASARDDRVKVLFGPRSGSPAAPRNRGFAVATGTYIVWLDGDDYLDDGVLEDLAATIHEKGDLDVIQGTLRKVTFNTSGALVSEVPLSNFPPEDAGRVMTGEEAVIRMMDLTSSPFWGAPLSVCRAAFLREKGLSFVSGIRHEDEEWAPRVFYFASRVLVVDRVFFYYRRNPRSIMSTQSAAKSILHHAKVDRLIFAFYASHDFSPALSRAWARGVLTLFYFHFFYPWRLKGTRRSDWRAGMRLFLKGEGLKNFLALAAHASAPKRVGARLVAICALHPILGWIAYVYFRFVYYPLSSRIFRRNT